ncbi:MAG: single-stranded DNA-binding protein [Chloroflexota bacterium]
MAGVNKVIIVGNLGRDPEMRYAPSGDAVTSFSVAVSRNYKTPDGEPREDTEWFNVSCWGRMAETANTYLSKGKQVYIEGRLKSRSYESNGEKRFSLDVRATEMQLLGQRGESGAPPSGDSGRDNQDLDNMPF